jgi:LCP family protein required for cell wall assembly
MTLGEGNDAPPGSPRGRRDQRWLIVMADRLRLGWHALRWHRMRAPVRRHSAWSIMLRSAAVLVAATLVAGSLTVYLTFRSDWQAIKHVDVSKDLASSRRPPADPHALNILLIGSDTRSGANGKIGGQAGISGARSDTAMVLHIAPGAHQAVVLSIPRDSVVPILTCSPEDGTPGQTAQPAGYVEQLNATFAYGGPGCLWKTIEQTTGIHLNDFIELTFAGFEHVIDDIGGVNVCLPAAVHDPQSRLNLSAGKHHIYGREALAFWRVRYIGEGSDLQRIRRDQFLMASLVQGVERSRLLHSPTELLSVINDVARHKYIAADTGLTPGRLFTIADELRGIKPRSVQFIEVPTQPYPGDPQAWVQWAQPQAARLFSAIARDTRISKPRDRNRAGQSARILGSSYTRLKPHRAPVPGPSSAGLGAATTPSRGATPGLNRNLAGKYGGITGNAPICGDASAFAGPDGYQ